MLASVRWPVVARPVLLLGGGRRSFPRSRSPRSVGRASEARTVGTCAHCSGYSKLSQEGAGSRWAFGDRPAFAFRWIIHMKVAPKWYLVLLYPTLPPWGGTQATGCSLSRCAKSRGSTRPVLKHGPRSPTCMRVNGCPKPTGAMKVIITRWWFCPGSS